MLISEAVDLMTKWAHPQQHLQVEAEAIRIILAALKRRTEALKEIAADEKVYLGHGDYSIAIIDGAYAQQIARKSLFDDVDDQSFNKIIMKDSK